MGDDLLDRLHTAARTARASGHKVLADLAEGLDEAAGRIDSLSRTVAELEREKATWGVLKPPSAQALEVFEKVLEHNPDADMKAVPNQWVLNARGITAKVAADFEDQIAALQRTQITPELRKEIARQDDLFSFTQFSDRDAAERLSKFLKKLRAATEPK